MMTHDSEYMEGALESNTGLKYRIAPITENGNNGYVIRPKGVNEGLFKIKVVYRNNSKLIAEFTPLDAQFTKSMDYSDEYRKELFSKYAQELEKNGRCSISINDNPLMPPYSDWPSSVSSLTVNLSRIVDSSTTDIIQLTVEWVTKIILLISSLLNFEQIYDDSAFIADGAETVVTQNKYERNPLNRKACLMIRGYSCAVCGFNFVDRYGPVGKDFIHVHHITPVSKLNGETPINPIKDLIPVCPNCHYMLHKRNPPYTVDELKTMLRN